jgi:hypothetical protein
MFGTMATVLDAETQCSDAVTTAADEPVECTAIGTIEPSASIPPDSATFPECTKPRRSRFGPCFKCGMNGHIARQCPNKSPAPGSGNQSRPQGQQNYTYDKVNHVTTEEAQQAQDIVLGMFLASSHPTIVLFDLGASHSFISSTFVAKHHLPISIMKHTMLVSSPGGERRTNHICPAVSITIRRVDFLANLIILDSKGIDIILGMDWLRKYDSHYVYQESNKVD